MAPRTSEPTGRKVGELATATGLTVRTLHYYEEIGLVVASARTAAGHRLYSDDDVARLYRVSLLRRLGLPLVEIGRALDDEAWNLQAAMTTHLSQLDERLEAETRLRGRLERLRDAVTRDAHDTTADLIEVMEEMLMLESPVQRRISILVYEDLEAAFEHLTRVFALGPGELTRDPDGRVVHGELRAGDGVVWLHPESRDYRLASPRRLGSASGSLAVMVEDVDSHFDHARERGAEIVYEPIDQPYGYREYSARDVEGHLWSFMRALD